MKKLFFILITVMCFLVNLFSQDEYVPEEDLMRNYDHVYIDGVKTVQFRLYGSPTSYPILNLDGSAILELTFDDLSEEVYDYTYEVVHCNADWTQSELTEMEYLKGFNNEVIRDYEFSINTLTKFINYRLSIPNQNLKITKSGNYLLHIYEDGDKELPVLTRRFMVVESLMQVIPQISRTGMVSDARTHQEIDFAVLHKDISINNPHAEVNVSVLQNGRWDNAITGLKPLFIKPEQLVYDYQGKISFPGGKEYRNFSTQSLKYKTEQVARIIEDKVDKYHIQLFSDIDRSIKPYIFMNDLNGRFFIDNDDRVVNSRLGADYAWVHFSLLADQEFETGSVYLFGALTDWQLKEEYKMTYNEREKIYATKAFLKQGYYDYVYAFKRGAGTATDFSELEGDSYETENRYQILVYYRPLGTRFDRLVGIGEVNSNN